VDLVEAIELDVAIDGLQMEVAAAMPDGTGPATLPLAPETLPLHDSCSLLLGPSCVMRPPIAYASLVGGGSAGIPAQ
jgi:hypothetical protein